MAWWPHLYYYLINQSQYLDVLVDWSFEGLSK